MPAAAQLLLSALSKPVPHTRIAPETAPAGSPTVPPAAAPDAGPESMEV
ncbi:hypothetical protein [Streptomyces sp. URMC 123]